MASCHTRRLWKNYLEMGRHTRAAPTKGSSITSYTVLYRLGSGSCASGVLTGWAVIPGISGSSTSYTISGLTNRTTYSVCVKATNKAGDSGWTEG